MKKGKGPILLDNIACKGTEMSLQECNLIWGSSKCTHDQDVYIKCDNPGMYFNPINVDGVPHTY